ncbi:ATP-dependent translocase ABCB1 [Trichonephila inaurata madagascariensis]|uniref:ABC-type xenobiotic transporter n=1 Tax=Trichonephila inaurata madagascariensis TaxID=2747483 RepID=A0A8X6KG00_9ARAC|nr:ATP-dependent translocase ABCB1 [Trichonephila inaurata madagascariensis]
MSVNGDTYKNSANGVKHSKSDFKDEFINGKYTNKGFVDTENLGISEENGKEDEKKTEPEIPPVGFFTLFRYSSSYDKVLITIAVIIALASGTAMPAVMIVFGKVIDKLIIYDLVNQNRTNLTMTTEEFLDETSYLCIINMALGLIFLICNYIMVSFFSLAAANQAFKIRCLFMSSVLKQDIGWYDTNETGDFASRITGDLMKIQDGIGEKVGICTSFLSSTVLCVGCGIWYGWKFALVILSVTPVLTIAMAILSKIQATVSREEMAAYGKAGAVAEEVLSSIRTVFAFGGERKEIQRYDNCLAPARKKGIKRGLMTAIGAGLTWFCIFAGYALAFWYGVKLVVEDEGKTNPTYTGGNYNYYFLQRAAAKIYNIIDRIPLIDSSSKLGRKPESLSGFISLKNVHFNYPARQTVQVLRGVSLNIQPGETVALVGPSGCGKSTIIQLILRFYDTLEGMVEIDGHNVRDLNVGWLRDNIGLVGQEPVLFSTTISENIRYGKQDATQEEIEEAAKVANVHDFINTLPLKYNTLVGERGTQLSGGQKQRIAIARALIKNPKILLLDEATSALDTESEAVVQAALDEARRGRTTVIVAHRLTTIRTADKIVVLADGNVKEIGTHDDLMNRKGIYFQLVSTQTRTEIDDDEPDEIVEDLPDLGRRISVLSNGSIGSGEGLPAVLQRQLSSTASTGDKKTPFGAGYDRQISAMSAFERQISNVSVEKDPYGSILDDEKLDKKASPSQIRLLKMSAPEWPYALVGALSALMMGLTFPSFGIIFGEVMGVLSGERDKISENTAFFCILFMVIAVATFVFNFLQVFMFSIAGEKLTSRLRKLVFSNIITQDMEFFDNPKNSIGSLCSRLTSDASSVQGATGARISTLLQAISTLIASIILAVWYNYKIGLLVLAFIPIVLFAAYFESRVVSRDVTSEKKGTEEASKVAIGRSRVKSHVRGIIFGFAQGLQAFAYGLTMYYGSYLVSEGEITYANLLKVLEGVMLGVMMIGQTVAFAPDYQKAKISAVRIFRLLDLKPKIDTFSNEGKKLHNVKILRGLSLDIEPGKTVALVGSSGCGKSTCVQLIERFYDTQHGSVFVDDENVREMNVANLRSHIGVVSQEPVLFSYSIAENIAYGDNSKPMDMNKVIEAARQANIHNFITTLPQGYDTPVGDKGTQLSGGQKQRVAIARALLRDPKILLLDEATSALDAESEKVVQEALDKARSGRTCLVIAHRLTTIQNADVIMVIHKGKVVEKGTHQELLNKKGHYYNLHNTQSVTQ